MNKEELTNRIQEGFFDLAPDMFDKIVEATEQPVESVVLNISDRKKSNSFYNSVEFKMLSRVAMLILVIGLGFGLFGLKKNQNVYIVAMDVNPSIQMELNNDYQVRKIAGLNADGEEIINQLGWKKNSSVEQTVGTITDKLVSEGYLKENSGILITLLKKDESLDYEELKNILNQELENDVSKCGVSGVKVAFQTVDTKTGQTGKEILKERMAEEYHLDHKEIDDMNIRDMFDYIENETTENQILENVEKPGERESIQGSTFQNNTTRKDQEERTKEQKGTSDNKEKKNSQSTTTEDSKSKQDNNKNSQEKTTEANNKNTQEKWPQPNNKNTQEKWPDPNSKSTQEKWPESNNKNTQEKWPDPNSKSTQEKWPESDNKNTPEKWPESDNKNTPEKWPESDNKNTPEKWPESDNKNTPEKWPEPDNKNTPEQWPESDNKNTPEKWPESDNKNTPEKWPDPYNRNNQELENTTQRSVDTSTWKNAEQGDDESLSN